MGRDQGSEGVAGATYLITGTDASAGIATIKLDDANGRRIRSILLECDADTGNGIRYAYGGTAPTVDNMHYLAPGSVISVVGYPNVKSLRIINNVALSNAKIWATPYY
jgi:hypothetical protein